MSQIGWDSVKQLAAAGTRVVRGVYENREIFSHSMLDVFGCGQRRESGCTGARVQAWLRRRGGDVNAPPAAVVEPRHMEERGRRRRRLGGTRVRRRRQIFSGGGYYL